MEVAGQWRREWAGTAEYGKVTEGGVTRRVARAMEVLHASAPGARVRVMRAAYHSTSGPGVPASSYMLHSSRRVISSGFNILESPTFPSKPLEISSTPLESSPELNIETENYKVTEPDDMDISEPSKWRGSTGGKSIRMPSEESSSTDNASIIDLDTRLHHKGLNRKYSYDSENSDVHSVKRSSTRASPLLDVPVTLSTLKYKSLLNNSNDWNNRRKSYSFEDTSPLNEIMVQSNDTLAMESSTDSGICKSSEIVNDYTDDNYNVNDFMGRDKRFNSYLDESSNNWHFKNKPGAFGKGPKMKSYKEHDIVIEDPRENSIALQSTGKVTITVPITIEGADDDKLKFNANDDGDRKVKKVEFCKTELHFAAESGRVNIIATDEKPPPSNDFRKRRSAFVPINDKFEKPITLFGDKNDISEKIKPDEFGIREFNATMEFEENTAATKSILKNKIPKPKPYLLGENMVIGETKNMNQVYDRPVPLGVSLINKELETQRICHSKETVYNYDSVTNKSFTDSLRTFNKGPTTKANPCSEEKYSDYEKHLQNAEQKSNNNSIRKKLSALQMSPVQKPKTRQLRESDLTFFGISNDHNNSSNNKITHIEHKTNQTITGFVNDTFESVRLIKQMSSSAQNSEAESDDFPEYQNIPLKTNFAPIPIPRSRVKYKKPEDDVMALKPIIEQVYDSPKAPQVTRRSRSRKQDEFMSSINRSRSEPARKHEREVIHKFKQQTDSTERSKMILEDEKRQKNMQDVQHHNCRLLDTEDDAPVYANYKAKENKQEINSDLRTRVRDITAKENSEHSRMLKDKQKISNQSVDSLEKRQNNLKKNNRVHRTEKLSTPEHSTSTQRSKDRSESQNTMISSNNNNSIKRKDNRITSSQRTSKNNQIIDKVHSSDRKESKILKHDKIKEKTQADITTKKHEYSKSTKDADQNSSDNRIHSKESRPANRDEERGSNTNNRRTSRRSEYVIKYDDKNGTVSSISKVRGGHSTSRQKHSSKDRNKENSKDMKAKSKNLEKSALLQLPEHRIVNGRNEDRKWNAKVHVKRSCQLL